MKKTFINSFFKIKTHQHKTSLYVVCFSILLCLILIFPNTLLCQNNNINTKKLFTEANTNIRFKNYSTALNSLLKINAVDSTNANINYLIGICYLNSHFNKSNAINYLIKSLKNTSVNYKENNYKETNAPINAYFYLAKAYHVNYQFNKALEYYNAYKSLIPVQDSLIQKNLEYDILLSKNGLEIVKETLQLFIENIGSQINSNFDEHTPVLTADESTMIFTSRRKGSTGNLLDNDGRFFEDIYISEKKDGKWQEPENIGEPINTSGHEASIGLSADGQELFIYRDDFGDGNIYVSKRDSNKWTKPIKLSTNINSTANETHASVSADGTTLYFVSDRKGGFGGKDIYFSKRLPNGEWSLAKNIGDKINTPYDEEGTFIHPDGFTLYFSSKGHNSMGGYDLFYSELQNDETWSKPKNMGYPINTTEDDVFYVLSADGKRAYYSCYKENGLGGKDIYRMNLLSLPERSLAVITGVVRKKSSDIVPKDIEITVTDSESGVKIGSYKPNKQTGRYTLILLQNKEYIISCEAKGCVFNNEIIKIPNNSSFYEINKPIELDPIVTVE